MKIFKFGGASVKDAESVRNLAKIVDNFGSEKLIIVISAMGKMTNAFEKLCKEVFLKDDKSELEVIKKYHYQIFADLQNEENDFKVLDNLFSKLENRLDNLPKNNYDYFYDQIVPFGELLSTTIVSHFLNSESVENKWVDARSIIKTDNNFRDAKIDWQKTEANFSEKLDFQKNSIFITQGFIGADFEGNSTTLGREGSDFTAAIAAYCTNATEVAIWKDVAGIFNADPNIFPDTTKLDKISYQEAIELAYYGAKVIHPKTIKPLQNKQIPLFVKSFITPTAEGTIISKFQKSISPRLPVYIVKEKQILISVSPKDFSFVAEKCINTIYNKVVKHNIKINLMQNSAINFSIVADNSEHKISNFIADLKNDFKVRYNSDLKLLTIRHYTEEVIKKMVADNKIFVEQRSRTTAMLVISK